MGALHVTSSAVTMKILIGKGADVNIQDEVWHY